MKAIIIILATVAFTAPVKSQTLTAASLLRDSRERLGTIQQQVDSANGSLIVNVTFDAHILGKKASGDASYRIKVKDGQDRGSELVGRYSFSDSAAAAMIDRQFHRRLNKSIMDFYLDTAFPWNRYLERADKKREFTAKVESDSAVVLGKRCFLISFMLDAENDSMSAEGEGKIWLDANTLLPVRTYRDFNMKTRRGKAEVKSSSDFTSLGNGIPVMVRSETQTIPKFLFISVGSIRTVVKQSDFNLE